MKLKKISHINNLATTIVPNAKNKEVKNKILSITNLATTATTTTTTTALTAVENKMPNVCNLVKKMTKTQK